MGSRQGRLVFLNQVLILNLVSVGSIEKQIDDKFFLSLKRSVSPNGKICEHQTETLFSRKKKKQKNYFNMLMPELYFLPLLEGLRGEGVFIYLNRRWPM